MNIIEQLGGYGKAKEIAFDPLHPQMTHVSNDGRHWVNEEFSHIPEIQEQIPTMIRIKDIRKALLEYRRQHNIFEVGDLVVDTNYKDSDVQEIKSVNGNRIEVFHKNKSYYFATFIFSFRHATDEEIKEGKRLEVTK